MPFKKSQATAEYLVLLAIVLVIVGSVAYMVINSIDSTEQDGRELGNAPGSLSLLNYQVDRIGTKMQLLNARPDAVTIHNITINGVLQNQSDLPLTLYGGEGYTLVTYSTHANASTTYEHETVISGIDESGTSFSKQFDVIDTSVNLASDFLTVQINEPVAENMSVLLSFDDYVNHAGYSGSGTRSETVGLDATEYVLGPHLNCGDDPGSLNFTHHEAFTLTNESTIAFWFRQGSSPVTATTIIEKETSYRIVYNTVKGMQMLPMSKGTSAAGAAASLPGLNNVSHYVFTYNFTGGGNFSSSAYKNAVLAQAIQRTNQNTADNNVSVLTMCNERVILDEVMFWQRVLTQEEIEMLYRRAN